MVLISKVGKPVWLSLSKPEYVVKIYILFGHLLLSNWQIPDWVFNIDRVLFRAGYQSTGWSWRYKKLFFVDGFKWESGVRLVLAKMIRACEKQSEGDTFNKDYFLNHPITFISGANFGEYHWIEKQSGPILLSWKIQLLAMYNHAFGLAFLVARVYPSCSK